MKPNLPVTSNFRDVSILIAAINETASLRKTVEIIYATCQASDIAEIIVAVSKQSTPECLQISRELEASAKIPFTVLVQTRRFAGGAYQDAFDAARGSHVIMMASDLETDPQSVVDMIAASKLHPDAIICTSRWQKKGTFGAGYNPVKFVLNYIFQKIMGFLFRAKITDWTFGYRLLPTAIVKAIAWKELRHPFFLETILKPLCLGVSVHEISTSWAPREEGESQNPFWRNFVYFRTVYAVLFTDIHIP